MLAGKRFLSATADMEAPSSCLFQLSHLDGTDGKAETVNNISQDRWS